MKANNLTARTIRNEAQLTRWGKGVGASGVLRIERCRMLNERNQQLKISNSIDKYTIAEETPHGIALSADVDRALVYLNISDGGEKMLQDS